MKKDIKTKESVCQEKVDWDRIVHLLKLGIISAIMVLIGDMLLGWGVSDPSVTQLPSVFTRYLTVSDGRIIASAMLGLIGIPIECLCWFSVYRLIRPYSEKDAHAYRAGIIGCLAFGGCGVHVPCCAAVYLAKHFYTDDPSTISDEMVRLLAWFLVPATVIFSVFFFLTLIVQIKAVLIGHTPFPRWCCVFSLLFGLIWIVLMRIIGDHAITNALSTGWISIGNLWMMGGLLLMSNKVGNNE